MAGVYGNVIIPDIKYILILFIFIFELYPTLSQLILPYERHSLIMNYCCNSR
jgi:hypothetical protein